MNAVTVSSIAKTVKARLPSVRNEKDASSLVHFVFQWIIEGLVQGYVIKLRRFGIFRYDKKNKEINWYPASNIRVPLAFNRGYTGASKEYLDKHFLRKNARDILFFTNPETRAKVAAKAERPRFVHRVDKPANLVELLTKVIDAN